MQPTSVSPHQGVLFPNNQRDMQKEVGERRGAYGHAGVWGKRVDKEASGKGSRVAEGMVEKKM